MTQTPPPDPTSNDAEMPWWADDAPYVGLVNDAFADAVEGVVTKDRAVTRINMRALRKHIDLSLLFAVTIKYLEQQLKEWGDKPIPTHDVSGEPLLPEFIDAFLLARKGEDDGKAVGEIVVRRRGSEAAQCVNAVASLVEGAPFKKPKKPYRM